MEVPIADGRTGNPCVLRAASTSDASVGKKHPSALVRKDMMATEATETTFEQEVLANGEKVIVDFWAEWCGPCHAVAPVLDRIADDHSVKIVKVNIDEEQGLAQRYGVSSIPMMILFENGAAVRKVIGAYPKKKLEQELEPALA